MTFVIIFNLCTLHIKHYYDDCLDCASVNPTVLRIKNIKYKFEFPKINKHRVIFQQFVYENIVCLLVIIDIIMTIVSILHTKLIVIK